MIGNAGPAGGFIFYDKGIFTDGWRYLEASPADEEQAQWGAYNRDVTGTSEAVGTGKANTEKIVTNLNSFGETGRAAQLCHTKSLNGLTGWFLPSIKELNIMYQNLHTEGKGNFNATQTPIYWSSSQLGDVEALIQNFENGDTGNVLKNLNRRVRAIRAY